MKEEKGSSRSQPVLAPKSATRGAGPSAAGEAARLAAFLREAAYYFERRPTGGEDAAFWANAQNASNCRRAAVLLEAATTRCDGCPHPDRCAEYPLCEVG